MRPLRLDGAGVTTASNFSIALENSFSLQPD
jgi:hypothetical protein